VCSSDLTCPGHWELRGDPDDGRLDWVEGQVRPDDAILEDFLALLDRRRQAGDSRHGHEDSLSLTGAGSF